MQHQKAPDGTITGVVGSAGSGKTGWLKQQIAGASRLLVWDIEGQYTERTRTIRTRAELVRAIQKDGRYSYQPATLQDFDFWARCAFVFCRIGAEAGQKTAIVAEELSGAAGNTGVTCTASPSVRRNPIKPCSEMPWSCMFAVCKGPTTAPTWPGNWTCRLRR